MEYKIKSLCGLETKMKKQQKTTSFVRLAAFVSILAISIVAAPAGIRAANFDSTIDPGILPMLDSFTSLPQLTLDENDQKSISINNNATQEEMDAAIDFNDYPYDQSSLATTTYLGGVGAAYAAANGAGEVPLINALLAQNNYESANSAFLDPEWVSSDDAKSEYQYPRPHCRLPQIDAIQTSGCPTTYGYPSGHTKIAWSEGVGLAIMLPEVAPQILHSTAEISNGRIVAGMHYPLDVMAGRAISTRMIAYRMHDDTWKAKFDAARTQLRSAIEDHCGMTVAACVAAQPPTVSSSDSITSERGMLTYDFTRIGTAGVSFQAPDFSYELLAYAFPNKTQAEKESILTSTAIDSGYPLDTTGTSAGTANIGWTRLDLGSALAWTDSVTPPVEPTSLTFQLAGASSGVGTVGFALSGACSASVSGQTVATPPASLSSQKAIVGAEFNVACGSLGASSQVEIQLDDIYDEQSLKVYKQDGTSIDDITSAVTISTKNVSGSDVSVVTYAITDGGFGDEDGVANGTIADPIFVTYSSAGSGSGAAIPSTPNTGHHIDIKNPLIIALLGIASAVTIALLIGKRTRNDTM